jgi:cytochrome P450
MLNSQTEEKLRRDEAYGKIPGDNGLPLLGHSFELLTNLRGLFQKMYQRHGPVFRMNLVFERSVVLLGPDMIQTVLIDSAKNFSSAKGYEKVFGQLFSRCIMMRDFDDHAFIRQLLIPAFKRTGMEGYLARMRPIIEQAVDSWGQQRNFHFYPAIRELALTLATTAFFGLELGPDLRRINGLLLDLLNATLAFVRKPIPGFAYAKGLKARRTLSDYLLTVIPEKRRNPSWDMLSQLCEARAEDGAQFSDKDVIDHMSFMIIAAFDSTTSTLASMAHALATYPEWQERLRDESRAASDAIPSFEELRGLKSADLVMKETLRLYGPTVMIPRQALNNFEVHGLNIPAGTTVWLSPDFSHHMPEWWSNPQTFDPERFNGERKENKRHRFSFTPFGVGAHFCLGISFADLMVKSMMHQILLTYRLGLPRPNYNVKFKLLPTAKPADNLPLLLEPLRVSSLRRQHTLAPVTGGLQPTAAVCPYAHQ